MADRQNMDGMAGKTPGDRRKTPPQGASGLKLVPRADRQLDSTVFNMMREAALGAERRACSDVLRQAMQAGVARDDLADLYIPELARQMGEDWCSDGLSFAAVTIGVSRLQAMLRELGPEWSSDQAASPAAAAIMLIVAQDVYHTLGALVLSGQLRRKGLSVRLMLGAPVGELSTKLSQTTYDAVFISASLGETLESLRKIVNVIRSSSRKSLPVVIGGTILEAETTYDVLALTGADYATSSASEALELCGLTTKYLTIAPMLRED